MMESEVLRFVRQEVSRQINIILSGVVEQSTGPIEGINQLYPGMDVITERPVMHPYGMVSCPPNGTLQVTARQGDHPANRIILGHRDNDRPTVTVGTVCIYNQYGQRIYMNNGQILVGSAAANEPFVLGLQVKSLFSQILDAITTHVHTGNLGAPTTPPTNAATFTTLKANFVANNEILSDTIKGE